MTIFCDDVGKIRPDDQQQNMAVSSSLVRFGNKNMMRFVISVPEQQQQKLHVSCSVDVVASAL